MKGILESLEQTGAKKKLASFSKILRVFTHTGDAIRKYEKVHGIESENKYEVQKTEPNPAKVSTKYFR